MHKLEYYILLALFALFRNISLKSAKKVANIICFIITKIIRYRRDVIIDNLNRVYGGQWPKEKKELIQSIYKNFTYLWMEFLQNPVLKKTDLNANFTVHNWDILQNAFKKGKGVIVISGHFGNFEWLGQYVGKNGYTVSGVAKRQSNPYVNKIVEKNRISERVKVIYVKNSSIEIPATLKKNEIVALVPDQDARNRGVFVDFLGYPSSTPVGPAVYHIKTGAPLLFGAAVRKDYGMFDLYFEDIQVGQYSEINDENILKITQAHASMLGKWIRRYPEQWFWMHKRWKTKPTKKIKD